MVSLCGGNVNATDEYLCSGDHFVATERRTELNVKRSIKLLGQMLNAVNDNLADKDYLVGSDITGAEFMTGHAVVMSHRFGIDMSDKEHLPAYVNRLTARKAFQRASNK